MKIRLTSVLVQDQAKALDFYTRVLGFVRKDDMPMGEHRWLTVVGPDEENGPELLLEPLGFAPAGVFQKELFDAGIPLTAFTVDDVRSEYERMVGLDVKFRGEPSEPYPGGPMMAMFEDTCGNHIAMVQMH